MTLEAGYVGSMMDSPAPDAEAAEEDLAVRLAWLEGVAQRADKIGHDLNNLLTVIHGYAELAKDVLPPDAPAVGLLDHVLGAAIEARELTSQLRADANSAPPPPR